MRGNVWRTPLWEDGKKELFRMICLPPENPWYLDAMLREATKSTKYAL